MNVRTILDKKGSTRVTALGTDMLSAREHRATPCEAWKARYKA